MLVALTICSQKFGSLGSPSFIIWLGVAGVAYLLAIREFFSTPTFPKRVIVIGLVLAAAWHLLFLMKPPGPDDDIHRYVWDGRVQRLGYNPYILIPADPALTGLHTPETRTLNNPWLPTIYPPGAELFFRGVTAVHETVFAMKAAFVACDVAIVFLLLALLRYRSEGQHWVLAYAWNPLLATEVAGSGHIDIVGALLLLISFVALERRWRTVAALAFGLAVSVKFLPLVLLPLYWKRVRLRDGALAAAVVALLYVPFFNHIRMPMNAIDAYRARMPIGSVGSYIGYFRFNDPVFATLERVVAPQFLVGLAVLVGLLAALYFRSTRRTLSADAFAWPMAASLLCAPAVYPWYLLWLLPFLRSASTVPVIVWTVAIIPTYIVWHLRTLGHPWLVPGWAMLLEYGCVTSAAAFAWFRHCAQTAAPTNTSD
jgi:hypothetical protein